MFRGSATYYDVEAGITACGKQCSDNDFICALNSQQFDPQTPSGNPNNNSLCGKKISVTGPKGTETVTIVDRLPTGGHGDLDLSKAAFERIVGPLSTGRADVKWKYL